MKINHNMSAVITNHQLLNNENSLSVSMEKLSSGLKLIMQRTMRQEWRFLQRCAHRSRV